MNTTILVYPRIVFEDNYPCSWIPYSLLALVGNMPQDINVVIFDQNRKDEDEFTLLIEKYKESLLCVGFSIMTGGGQIKNALQLATILKAIKPDVKIVFGGPHVNVLPQETLNNNLI
ncbi:MAG: cobalamin-dependent protein, partial [Planctomycetaceae bacterium]|nr:cobalamin-dependent protein [Planctomycetaceae bacterium]